VLRRISRFKAFIDEPIDDAALKSLRQAETTGRPVGDNDFIETLELLTERTLKPAKRGPKPKERREGGLL
jgi:putative transposase